MLSSNQISKLRRFMELREARDQTKLAHKRAEEEYRAAESDLYEDLADGPVSRLNNVDLGPPWGKVSFGARETYFARLIPGKEDEALAYFESRAMVDELTQPKFVMKRLNEVVRGVMEGEGGGELPPGVDFYANRGVTITRQKGD